MVDGSVNRGRIAAATGLLAWYNPSMTLRDHFHPPLSTARHWHAFHNAWATYIAAYLNEHLPEGYFAEPNVQFGIEIDVAAFNGNGHTADENQWHPPAPVQTLILPVTTDIVEVGIFQDRGGPTLAAAIELVSPANKDRPAHRDAFVQKCATYVREGVGLVVVDVVTERSADLHGMLLAQFASTPAQRKNADLFAASYRPVQRDDTQQLDIWFEPASIGAALPTVPLWLPGDLCLPLELHTTYERTCREQRLM